MSPCGRAIMNATLYKQKPKPRKTGVIGYIASDAKTTHFYDLNDNLVTSLQVPEIKFIGPDGILLRGFEPVGFTVSGVQKLVYQEWLLSIE